MNDLIDRFTFPFEGINDSELFQFLTDYNININDSALLLTDDLKNLFRDMPNNAYISTEDITLLPKSDNSFSILQINARSLQKNFIQIKSLIDKFSILPSVISLSETWLKNTFNTILFNIKDYDFISVPRKGIKSGGGVGLYINNLFTYIIRHDLADMLNSYCECCIIEILNDKSPNIIIIGIYKPP